MSSASNAGERMKSMSAFDAESSAAKIFPAPPASAVSFITKSLSLTVRFLSALVSSFSSLRPSSSALALSTLTSTLGFSSESFGTQISSEVRRE